ncbi:MAG TPA: hypothetical protein VMB84_15530, partial [Stellaceae bacterium]|nr:hypothetical protein [Stellaceae bacterium]
AAGLRVNAQLIDSANGQHLWIDRFDTAIGEPFAMQREVVARLIPPLHAHLLAASGRAPQPAPAPAGPVPGSRATGVLVQPRTGGPAAGARAPAGGARVAAATSAAPRAGVAPATREPPVRVVAVAPPPAQPAAPRAPLRLPLWLKLLAIVAAGGVALAMLGARRGSIVEIVSWMLIAAGAVQLASALLRGRPA